MKTSLTLGFLLALAGSLTSLGLFLTGYHDSAPQLQIAQWIQVAVGTFASTVCLAAAMRAKRMETPADQEWGYAAALGSGVLTGFFGVLIGGIFSYLYYKLINPNLSEILLQMQLAKMAEMGMSPAAISDAEPTMRRWMMPEIMTLMQALSGLIGTTALAALVALFFRQRGRVLTPAPAA